jgi:hypothetical protein
LPTQLRSATLSVIAEIQIYQRPLKIDIFQSILISIEHQEVDNPFSRFQLIHIKTVSKLSGHATAAHPIVLFATQMA